MVRALPWLIAAVGIAERAVHLGQFPSGFLLTMDYDAANAARTIFLGLTPHTVGWQQAWLAAHVGRFIEPPVTQLLTALTYLPDGVERPWTAALFTNGFWVAAAVLLFAAIRRMTGWSGATLAFAFLLLAPFAVAISEAFQQEAYMVFAFSVAAWYAARGDVIDGRRLVFAAVIGGVAGLAKAGVMLPFIAAIFVASAARAGSLLDQKRAIRLLVLLALVALPSIAYVVIVLPDQVGDKALLQLLFQRAFYLGWARNVARFVGVLPVVGGALGFVLFRPLRPLGLLLGLAYLGYSAIFTYHTMTHDYYQVPLLIIVAIGLGGLAEVVVRWVGSSPRRRWAAGLAFAVAVAITWARTPVNVLQAPPGSSPDQARYEQVGAAIGPGEAVIAYSPNYGLPFMYYSRLLVTAWPDQGDLAYLAQTGRQTTDATLLSAMVKGPHPRYFVVFIPSTGPPVIDALLAGEYQTLLREPGIRIYDLTRPLSPVP